MIEDMKESKLTRRQLMKVTVMSGAGVALAACAPAAAPAAPVAPAATEAPKPTDAPKAEEKPTEAPKPTDVPKLAAGTIPDIPREQTLILGWGHDTIGISNPWAAGYTHQDGNAFLWEPLFYFAIFADKELPWIAESGEYNKEFTELTVKLRKGAAWSDGKPVTADDVLFTLESQLKNDKLNYHTAVDQFVKEIKKTDDLTGRGLHFQNARPTL